MGVILGLVGCGEPTPSSVAGFGALFWDADKAWQVGGGVVAVSRTAHGELVEVDGPRRCSGRAVAGAPAGARLVLPQGATPAEPLPRTALMAETVETAVAHLHASLPTPDRYSPPTTGPLRGVAPGTVAKVRRDKAPPVLVASGTRDCHAVVALLDREATEMLASVVLSEWCGGATVHPPEDLDGDGLRELALLSEDRVELLRMVEKPPGLEPLGGWRCID